MIHAEMADARRGGCGKTFAREYKAFRLYKLLARDVMQQKIFLAAYQLDAAHYDYFDSSLLLHWLGSARFLLYRSAMITCRACARKMPPPLHPIMLTRRTPRRRRKRIAHIIALLLFASYYIEHYFIAPAQQTWQTMFQRAPPARCRGRRDGRRQHAAAELAAHIAGNSCAMSSCSRRARAIIIRHGYFVQAPRRFCSRTVKNEA